LPAIVKEPFRKAIAILKAGGIVAYPTDTVYGLGADGFNERAVNRIYRIKKRPPTQPLSVLIADEAEMARLADSVPDSARRLAGEFWPGGLTIVVRKAPQVPLWVTGGSDTIGVRVPNHPVTLELIRGLGKPLIGTSANLSGSPSCTNAEEVRAQLGESVDFILDGGVCPGGIESTVVDVTGELPRILREGAIPRHEIETILRDA